MKRKHIISLILCLVLASLAVACGPQNKPEELTQLEELRNSEEAAVINGGAPDAYKKCTDLTNKAIDSWQDGEQAQARTYAALGQRQYATARAQAKLKEAQDRQTAAENEMKSLNAQMETLNAQRNGLEESISLIKKNIANSDMANAEARIQLAKIEREKAVGVQANETQKETFEQAEARLKDAQEKASKGERAKAGAAAEEARLLYVKSYDLAKPDFDKKQLAAASAERQKGLFTEAQAIVGPTYVFTDLKSTIIVLAAAFEKGKSDILPVKQDALRRVAELANKYSDATVMIEGYTQTRDSKAYEVSQRRCDATRDFLVTQGVDYKRIVTTAKGKEAPRYDESKKDNRAQNDRVEINIILP